MQPWIWNLKTWKPKKNEFEICYYMFYIDEEKHKLVNTINRSLDQESNPWPLAYDNTVSIKGGNNDANH
jgi:hypothetical protein